MKTQSVNPWPTETVQTIADIIDDWNTRKISTANAWLKIKQAVQEELGEATSYANPNWYPGDRKTG